MTLNERMLAIHAAASECGRAVRAVGAYTGFATAEHKSGDVMVIVVCGADGGSRDAIRRKVEEAFLIDRGVRS